MDTSFLKYWTIPKDLDNLLKDFDGRVVTRFPPEPSGYLHLGHVKAIYINYAIAAKYHGRMIFRFDDTNPSKASAEYSKAILADIQSIGINLPTITNTSDYFDLIISYADFLVDNNLAYVDDTDANLIQEQRSSQLESKNRNTDTKINQLAWLDMKFGLRADSCVRIKISMTDPNACMRDPIIFRCGGPHYLTGLTHKVYPTYDFSCPIVDSVEGVTHVFRSTEFIDRNAQYKHIGQMLGLRHPIMYNYGKLNFTNAVMSKRQIKNLIDQHKIGGWDDPRLYTVRGARRRGLCTEALKDFVGRTGITNHTINIEDSMLWTINKKHIDLIALRSSAIRTSDCRSLKISQPDSSEKEFDDKKIIPKYLKNPNLGSRDLCISSEIIVGTEEISSVTESEEITLLNWTNVIYKTGKLIMNPTGSYKDTKKKLIWLAAGHTVCVITHTYRGLHKTCLVNKFLAEDQIKYLKKGSYVQFYKMGYYICDEEYNGNYVLLIEIPG